MHGVTFTGRPCGWQAQSPPAPGVDARRPALQRYGIRTEQSYLDWVKRFIRFHGKRHPKEMGAGEVRAFLTHLAVEGNVAASTQNQALNALLFLYSHVLQLDLPYLQDVERARRPKKLPVVLTRQEARGLLDAIPSPPTRSWPGCSTAAGCGSWNACGCASRTWTSPTGNSPCATAKA